MTTDATFPLLQMSSHLSLLFTITHNTKMIYFNEQSTLLWHAFHIQLIRQIQLNRVEDRDSGGDWREGQKRRSELNALTYWRCVFNKGHTGQNRAINLPVSLGTDTKSAFEFWVFRVLISLSALLLFWACRQKTRLGYLILSLHLFSWQEAWCELGAAIVRCSLP